MSEVAPEVVVLTGAGVGLGRAMASELTRKGRRVAGFARTADALEETRRLCARPELFLPITCDIADEAATRAAFAHVRDVAGPVMRLINNAAVYPRGDLLSEPPSPIMDCVAVNLGGMVNCALMALADMTEAGHGRILNVSTFADLAPLPGSSAYSVSKGAARIFTRALIADVCDRFPRIVINDWMPGQLATRMGLADGLDPAVAAHWGVALALSDDPSLTGSIFERDAEQLPPRSLKRRLVERVTLQRAPAARRLLPA